MSWQLRLLFCLTVGIQLSCLVKAITIADLPLRNSGGLTDTLVTCEERIYRWSIPSQSSRYSIELDLTSKLDGAAFTLTLSKTMPNETNYAEFKRCPFKQCSTLPTLDSTCKIEEGCALKLSNEVLYITITSSAGDAEFEFSYRTNPLPLPSAYPVMVDKNAQVPGVGQIEVPTANLSNPLEKYDLFTIQLPSPIGEPEGTRVLIDVVEKFREDGDPSAVATYLNYGNDLAYPIFGSGGSECVAVSGRDTLEINSCYFSQGGIWQLTVERLVENCTYDLKVYVDRPVIIDITEGSSGEKYYELPKVDSVVYFRYKLLSDVDRVLFAVLDNVHGGTLQLAVNYEFLPFQQCSGNETSCTTYTGCHTRHDPCSIKGKTSKFWYFGVKVLSIDDQTEPVSFTISAHLRQNTLTTLTPGTPAFTRALRGQYQHFKIDSSSYSGNNWVNVYVYLDATKQPTGYQGDVDAVVFVNNKPYAGAEGCYSRITSCALRVSDKDYLACSIQLDPCQLQSVYQSGIYLSLWVTDSVNYFWQQDVEQVSIEVDVRHPELQPYVLFDNYVHTAVVAEGEYVAYRLPPTPGNIQITVTSAPETTRVLPPVVSVSDSCPQFSGLPSNCTARAGCGYCQDQCISCSASGGCQPIVGCSKKRSIEQSNNDLAFYVVYGSNYVAPSCPCWNRTAERYQIVHGDVQTFSISGCAIDKAKDGLFVFVYGIPRSINNQFSYRQERYVISSKIETVSSSTTIYDLYQGKANEIYGDMNYVYSRTYKLNFDRSSLLSSTLVITLESHVRPGVSISLSSASSGSTLGCSAGVSLGGCTVNSNNDGFCRITKPPCLVFSSDSDSSDFYVTVTYPGGSSLPSTNAIPYGIYFELVPNTPRSLAIGELVSDVSNVNQDLYKHYSIYISDDMVASKKTLIITSYFDVGHLYSDNVQMHFYANSPSQNRLAGAASDCLCAETAQPDQQKVVYVVNSCQLTAGTYYFSVRTSTSTQYLYSYFPAKYTVVARLLDAIVNLPYEMPMDYSLYVGQRVIFKLDVPSSMVNDPNDVQKILKLRLSTTESTSTVQGVLYDRSPAECRCDATSLLSCTIAPGARRPTCETEAHYCNLTAGDWYLDVIADRSYSSVLPVQFSVYASKKNNNTDVKQLTVDSGCKESERVPVSQLVASKDYQHYLLNYPSGVTGEELVQIYIDNVTNGYVTVSYNTLNLATDVCNIPTSQTCTDSCVLSASCVSRVKYLSVHARSPKNDDVKYKISVCKSTINRLTMGTDLPNQVATVGNVNTYAFSMSSVSSHAAIVIQLKNMESNSAQSALLTISQGSCSSCSSYSYTTNCSGTSCSLPLLVCSLPDNYNLGLWFVRVVNVGGDDLTYTLLVKAYAPSETASPIPNGLVTIPPLSWKTYTWTINPSEIISDGAQYADIKYNYIDSFGAAVLARVSTNMSSTFCPSSLPQTNNTFVVGACCIQPNTYYLSLFNTLVEDPSDFEIYKLIDSRSKNTSPFTWDLATESTTGTISVLPFSQARVDSNLPYVYHEALISYPGLDPTPEPATSYIVHIEPTASDFSSTIVTLYMNSNKMAGPDDDCFGSSNTITSFNKYTSQRFACSGNPVSPSDNWFGFKNDDTSTYSFKITALHAKPMSMKANQPFVVTLTQPYQRSMSVTQQIYVDISSIRSSPYRSLTVMVTADSESIFVSLNKDHPAGSGPCQGSIVNASLSEGETQNLTISSCSISSGRYYIGVTPTSQNNQNVKYTILVVEDTSSLTDVKSVTLGSTLRGEDLPTGSSRFYTFRTPASLAEAGNLAYVALAPQGLDPTPTLQYSLDSSCEVKDTVNCNSFTCSGIVFPCDLRADSKYITMLTNQNTTTSYDLKASLITAPITELQAPGSIYDTIALKESELRFYRVSLTSKSFTPGQSIQFKLSYVSCGEVEVYLNKHRSAGPTCMLSSSKVCSSSKDSLPCTMYQFSSCQLTEKDNDFATDWYITVRGINQYSLVTPIQFQLDVDILSNYTMKEIHPNEKHTLYSLRTDVETSTCPVINRVPFPQDCCSVNSSKAAQYIPENIVWVYPIEGAQFLDPQSYIELELDPLVTQATIYLKSDSPHFCPTTPESTQYISSRSCTATVGTNRKCTINIPQDCTTRTISGMRQVYLWVDPNSIVGVLTAVDNSARRPLAKIKNVKSPYAIVDINYQNDPLYVRFELANNERQYFRIIHPDNYGSIYNYLSTATILRSEGGTVSIYGSLDECTNIPVNKICTETKQCKSTISSTACSKDLPDCTCSYNTYPCESTFNPNRYTFMTLKATTANSTSPYVFGKIEFNFTVPVKKIPDNCDQVRPNKRNYYDHGLVPTAEQIFRFETNYLGSSSGVTMYVNENRVADSQSCSYTSSCTSTGRKGCWFYYRRNDPNYVSVVGSSGSVSTHDYLLKATLENVKVVKLTNATFSSTPSRYLDGNNCSAVEYTNYYKYTVVDPSSYLLIELSTSTSNVPVFVYPGHVTYQYGIRSCYTQPSTRNDNYCNILFSCGLKSSTTYYFHIPDSVHSFKVTEKKVSPIPIALNVSSPYTLTDRGDLVVLELNNAGGFTDNPTKDLQLTYFNIPGVSTWVSRNSWGDSECSVETITDPNGVYIPECMIHKTQDKFYVSYFAQTDVKCGSATGSLRPYFENDGRAVTTAVAESGQTSYTVSPSEYVRFYKSFQNPLGENDVVYVRINDVQFGELRHRVYKGNHIKTPATTSYPCDSSCEGSPDHDYVSWHDNCFHCGDSIYQDVFVDVIGTKTYLQHAGAIFTPNITVAQWNLLSTSSIVASLPGPTRALQFYKANLSQKNAFLFELTVTRGSAVEVSFYAKNCGYRTTTERIWCFKGHPCQIPFVHRSNFGSYRYAFDGSTPIIWDDSEVRIVVAGHDTDYKVRSMIAGDACSAIGNVGYCTARIGTTTFGNGNTNNEKDAWAQEIYQKLYTSFSCKAGLLSGCDCIDLSQECKNLLKQYSCDTALPRCDANGFRLTPDFTLTQDIQRACLATFVEAGLNQLSDGHNYYNGGIIFVPGGDSDRPNIVPSDNSSSPANIGAIVGGIVGAIVGIALIGVVAYLVSRRGDSSDSSGTGTSSSSSGNNGKTNPYVIL